MTRLLQVIAVAAVVCSAGAARAQIFINGTEYGAAGSAENLTATFTNPDGGVTTGKYDDLVEITVSGTGMSEGAALNDAFYLLGPPPYNDANYYQMTFGTGTLTAYDPAADIKNFIVYDMISGKQVTPAYVPAYETDNTYSFIIDTGAVSLMNLHFGVSDGQYGDNTGAYQIAVTQLDAIPEPGALIMVALGAGAIFAMRRRPRVIA